MSSPWHETPAPTLAVVLASAGRPALLADILQSCAGQTDVQFQVVVSVPDRESLPDDSLLQGVRVVTGTKGLAAQRNAALDALSGIDVVAFFDDDAVLRPDYLSTAIRFLQARPEVVGLTGRVLLDGASGSTGAEIPAHVAAESLAASSSQPPTGRWVRGRELYGCNFVVRVSAAPKLRFDARLPLYSWLEDHDFARRLMPFGTLGKVDDCVIVHRGAASGGRRAHARLGYSQVMNPVYLARKGSFPLWLSAQQIFRVVAKNVALSVAGPSAAWRRQRLKGNLWATRDALSGRITPERIVDI